MSTSEPLPAEPNPPVNPSETEDPPAEANPSETEDPPATPDPLLGSGSFIDPTNQPDQTTPKDPPEIPTNSANTDPLLQKYARPSWLPDDWEMILKKRTSGATEGTVDRYYISPSGRRLRSKNEVTNFLETGSKRKKPDTPTSDDTPSKATPTPKAPKTKATSTPKAPKPKTTPTPKDPTTQTKKKTSARKKVHAAFTFDFKNPPEKVSWCLSYASEDVWSPSIGDWTIPLATKQEWAAVFNHVCQN